MSSPENAAKCERIWHMWDRKHKNAFGAWEKTQAKVTLPAKFQDTASVKFAFAYEGTESTTL